MSFNVQCDNCMDDIVSEVDTMPENIQELMDAHAEDCEDDD